MMLELQLGVECSHLGGEQYGHPGGADIGNALACDIVGGSVRRRANRERKAAEQGDAAVEAHQLHRDLALIVIHGQHGIKHPALGAQEYRVGGERSVRLNAEVPGLLNRWPTCALGADDCPLPLEGLDFMLRETGLR
jgi:hypothetical protein